VVPATTSLANSSNNLESAKASVTLPASGSSSSSNNNSVKTAPAENNATSAQGMVEVKEPPPASVSSSSSSSSTGKKKREKKAPIPLASKADLGTRGQFFEVTGSTLESSTVNREGLTSRSAPLDRVFANKDLQGKVTSKLQEVNDFSNFFDWTDHRAVFIELEVK
jgi:hypothetical protein